MSASVIAWLNPVFGFEKTKKNIGRVGVQVVNKNAAMHFAVQKKKETRSGLVTILSVVFLALNVVLLFSYFFAINNYSAKGFELRQLGLSVKNLETENKKIAVKLSEQGSIASIKRDLELVGFVPVLNVEYVGERQVVVR